MELLKELEIIEDLEYVHDYFGDVKQLFTEVSARIFVFSFQTEKIEIQFNLTEMNY